jgi:uncharacterized membrane protein
MHWLPFVLMVIAAVLFLVSAWRPAIYHPRFVPLGLAFLTAGLIFEFIIRAHSGLIIIH